MMKFITAALHIVVVDPEEETQEENKEMTDVDLSTSIEEEN